MCQIVNLRRDNYDVYIGRGNCPNTGRPSIWGNPFTHIADKDTLAEFVVSTREEAIERYREYILSKPELLSRLDELDGKVLGCWCKPKSCHGDILSELITQKKFAAFMRK